MYTNIPQHTQYQMPQIPSQHRIPRHGTRTPKTYRIIKVSFLQEVAYTPQHLPPPIAVPSHPHLPRHSLPMGPSQCQLIPKPKQQVPIILSLQSTITLSSIPHPNSSSLDQTSTGHLIITHMPKDIQISDPMVYSNGKCQYNLMTAQEWQYHIVEHHFPCKTSILSSPNTFSIHIRQDSRPRVRQRTLYTVDFPLWKSKRNAR